LEKKKIPQELNDEEKVSPLLTAETGIEEKTRERKKKKDTGPESSRPQLKEIQRRRGGRRGAERGRRPRKVSTATAAARGNKHWPVCDF